jgi:UDPglucose 6-dehydrogenase
LVAYDPAVASMAGLVDHPLFTIENDPYLAAKNVDGIVVLTEWSEFRMLDWSAIARECRAANLIDTRNIVDRDVACRAGFKSTALGRRGFR